MEIEIRREGQDTWMILKHAAGYEMDYQIKMLEHASLDGLLQMKLRETEEGTDFHYRISNQISLKQFYKKHPLDEKDMLKITDKILGVVDNMGRFLLDPDRLVLNPSCIYMNDEMLQLCYLPIFRRPFGQSFHQLTEYFVRELDYENPAAVQVACRLHKYTMQENYRLRDVLVKVQEETKETAVLFEETEIQGEDVSEKRSKVQKPKRAKPKMSKWGDWENL
jgi:hypothetical protein